MNGLHHKNELDHLRNIFACDELFGVLQHFPSILEKSFYPYACIDWAVDRRFQEVENHFINVKNSFGKKATEIYKPEGYCLFEFTANDDEKYTVELCPGYQCEGSMGVRLCDSDKREVYALSFHLSDQDTNACYISGLQGPNDRIPDRQKTIVTITRSLHGLRPKSLMVVNQHPKLINFSSCQQRLLEKIFNRLNRKNDHFIASVTHGSPSKLKPYAWL